MKREQFSPLPIAVIGAGPVGLAAAAHLAERGLPFVVYEAGRTVAHNLVGYGHVRLFSPWRFNVDRAATRLLEREGWSLPEPQRLPTAGELVEQYLDPLAKSEALSRSIRLNARVIAISRARHDKSKTGNRGDVPFVLHVESGGGTAEHLASAVIDASGTWSQPNPLGGHGLPAIGEKENAARIAYGMPDILGAGRARYAGRKVLVVGAGHSAAGNLISLSQLAAEDRATRVVWAVRGNDLRRLFGGGANDGLPARGALGRRLQELVAEGRLDVRHGFRVQRIEKAANGLRIVPDDHTLARIEEIDEIIGATGARPNLEMARELRLSLDHWLESTDALAPLIDPNVHSCGTVRPHGHRELAHPEPGFYAIGAKSYGRAPNFLMATGYEQARSVVAALAGDFVAADDVQLELPQTGVCSTDFGATAPAPEVAAATGCCGGPAKVDESACCALDEEKKLEGEAGCGCADMPVAAAAPKVEAVAVAAVRSCCR